MTQSLAGPPGSDVISILLPWYVPSSLYSPAQPWPALPLWDRDAVAFSFPSAALVISSETAIGRTPRLCVCRLNAPPYFPTRLCCAYKETARTIKPKPDTVASFMTCSPCVKSRGISKGPADLGTENLHGSRVVHREVTSEGILAAHAAVGLLHATVGEPDVRVDRKSV